MSLKIKCRYGLVGLWLCLAPFLTAWAQAADTVVVAMDGGNPPFSTYNNQTWAGFEVDLLHALCDEMQVQCSIIAIDSNNREQLLLSGQADFLMASHAVTVTVDSRLVLSNHYYSNGVRFVAPKTAKGRISYKGLADKVVGVVANSRAHQFLVEKFNGVIAQTFTDHSLMYQALLAGEVEMVLADHFVQSAWLQTHPDYRAVGSSYTNKKYFSKVAVLLSPKGATWRERLNQAIKAVRASGQYKKIRQKYFAFAIFGR